MTYESTLSLKMPNSLIEAVKTTAKRVCEETGLDVEKYGPAIAGAIFKTFGVIEKSQTSETQSRQLLLLKEVIEASRLYPFDNLQDAAKEVNAALKILEDGTKPDSATSRSGTL